MTWAKAFHLKVPVKAQWASSHDWPLLAFVAAFCFFAGKLGLSLVASNLLVPAIWPLAGFALAAVLILGYRIWPGILAGAFLSSLTALVSTRHPPLPAAAVAICQASGETLQALVTAWLLETYAQGRDACRQPRTLVLFVALAALAGTSISASSNALSSLLAGFIQARQLGDLWAALWLANAVGVLLIAPLLLLWSRDPVPKLNLARSAEAAAIILLLTVGSAIAFGGWRAGSLRSVALSCLIVPVLMWTAFRFAERGASAMVFLLGCFAVAGGLRGQGPFEMPDRQASLLLLQNFLAAIAFMSLLLAAEVSQRRRIDTGLRASEQRYRDLFDQTPQPMWLFDYESLRFLAVNQAAVRHYGYARDEFLAMTIADIHPPEAVAALPDLVKQARQLLPVPLQHRHRKKNGELIDVEIHRRNLLVGGREAAMILVTDITERLRAETALRESDQRLRLALAAGRMGIWTLELQGEPRLISSPELDAIFGLKPGEFGGSEQELFALIHPEDHALVRNTIAQAVKTEGDYEIEFRILPRDRPGGWLRARGRALFDARGNSVRLLGVAFDISARKTAEQEILRLNLDLERRVAERTLQLETINKELESFSYSVSHDLRAPLRSIRGFSEVLLGHYAGKLDARGREFLKRACESSHHMDLLIEDLLKLSRIGRADLHQQPVDLTLLAETIVADLRASAPPTPPVRVLITPGLQACGDERLLRILLENLLRNAWKFTANQPRPKIEFGRLPAPDGAFFIRDNGAGFDMAHAGRLFGVFQRLHSSAEFPGTGIGLATVQRILNRHGGHAWAEGAVGQGATFYFTLPAGLPSTGAAAPCPQALPVASPQEQVSA